MNILVTNDDGIDSPGISALVQALRTIGNVTVVAPDRQQSAVGHSLTISSPLRATPFHRDGEIFGYAINGTPADCVKLAISTLLPQRPDVVVSGINHGANTSINVLYSGTVSAATEGMFMGIPSVAVSLNSFRLEADCTAAAEIAAQIVSRLMAMNLPKDTLLNVNVPSLSREEIKGIRITRLSNSEWRDEYECRQDPIGRDYYWIKGEFIINSTELDMDDVAVREGYVSVTPIKYQLTNHDLLSSLNPLTEIVS